MAKIFDALQLTRDDMRGFPEESIKYVLELQKDKGWRGTRSNRNHLALLAPDGVERLGLSTNPSGLRHLKQLVRKYYKDQGEEPVVEKKKVVEKYTCPRLDCPKVYASLEQLNVHTGVDHEGMIVCAEPGCYELFKRPAAMGLHRARKHGYQSPGYKQRKKQEAARAQKETVDAILENADSNHVALKDDLVPMPGTPESVSLSVEEAIGMKAKERGITREMLMDELFPDPELPPVTAERGGFQFVGTHITEMPELTDQERVQLAFYDSNEVFDRQFAMDAGTPSEEINEPNRVEIRDSRDSWTLDLKDILAQGKTVEEVITMMSAAGLGTEIRVWRI